MSAAASADPAARATLRASIEDEANRTVAESARAMSDAIVARHKDCIVATLFYGSCLRPPNPGDPREIGPGGRDERLMDFYAVVDDLRLANGGVLGALGNRLLAPNVFYLEAPHDGGRVRCKYAVLTLAQLRRGVAAGTLQNYFWGRFCQPTVVTFAGGAGMRDALIDILAQAVVSAVASTAPVFDEPFTAADLWTRTLRESYGAELRPESAERPRQVHDADAARYAAITPAALAAAGLPATPDAFQRFAPAPDARRRAAPRGGAGGCAGGGERR
ncbi:MAG: hypothetical protein IPK81_17995 [Rhodospirillales bacterium]|nr:MAG: hypothetical protein IPK81_17995 [Rhodospirillales bacterium]